jgi:hypothetical protein
MNEDERTTEEPAGGAERLRVIEGGRAALEWQALRAVLYRRPDADALIRRLGRPANANLSVVPSSDP